MTKLTTERLEKKIKSCIEIENCEVMMPLSAAQELLAFRNAAKNPIAWVVGDEEIADFKNGREVCVMRDCDDEQLDYLPLYAAPVLPKQPRWPAAEVERDALRYRFLRDKDFFGDEDEPGLVGWEGLVELGYNEFDAAVDARISHPDIDYVKLDTALRKHIPAQPVSEPNWVSVADRLPSEFGRYLCYVEEQNDLGKSHYQWNCSWNGDVFSDSSLTGRVTHWMPLPAAPAQESE
mgnify:FL=1|jgi:hypothetical protein|uniref:DUF551 domain-containing protein n=1 Tax=Hafnia alvei TaxID=569 RepID=UPI00248D7083|nr:DUF551 domain-containing protein [Hafnia alvei]